jgi:hypothetical protein
MRSLFRVIRIRHWALLAAWAAVPASAVELPTLPQSSPFGVKMAAVRPTEAAPQLKFLGVYADGQEHYFFSIWVPELHHSQWVGLNECGYSFTIRSYDRRNETLVVEYDGRLLTLPLHMGAVTPSPFGISYASEITRLSDYVTNLRLANERTKREPLVRRRDIP